MGHGNQTSRSHFRSATTTQPLLETAQQNSPTITWLPFSMYSGGHEHHLLVITDCTRPHSPSEVGPQNTTHLQKDNHPPLAWLGSQAGLRDGQIPENL